jgi:hypothetical protein
MARDLASRHGIVFRERAQASQSWLCDCDHAFVRGCVIKIDQQPVALENVDDLVQLRLRGDRGYAEEFKAASAASPWLCRS